jgi:hypothetical protein
MRERRGGGRDSDEPRSSEARQTPARSGDLLHDAAIVT